MASIAEVLSAMQNGVTAIRDLTKQLSNTFPPITTLTTAAPAAGTVAYSSQAVAFGLVQTSSGGTYRIALLPSS